MARPFLSVIIPAYNEAQRIPLTLVDLDHHLAAVEFSYEIIVVDDNSTDKTPAVVTQFGEMIKNLRLERNPGKLGYGNTIAAGMRAAHGEWRLTMDADNSISIQEFVKAIPYLRLTNGFEVLLASRVEKGSRFDPPLPTERRIAEWLLNRFIRLAMKSRLRDTLLGFRCFSSGVAERVFGAVKIEQWGGVIEGVLLAERLGYPVKEIPVSIAHVRGSHFLMRDYLQIAWGAVKIRWWLNRGKYNINQQPTTHN